MNEEEKLELQKEKLKVDKEYNEILKRRFEFDDKIYHEKKQRDKARRNVKIFRKRKE